MWPQHRGEKAKSETTGKKTQIKNLTDKHFTEFIINMFKELKESMLKEVKQNNVNSNKEEEIMKQNQMKILEWKI